MKRLAKVALIALVGFVGTTLAALEGPEVVVLYTPTGNGQWRQTRVWIADHDGTPWIEAAGPDRGFYRDLLANPQVEVQRGDKRAAYRAVAFGGREGHELIRRLLRQKYGWADAWIGLLADTSHSIAIRLDSPER